LTNFPAPSMSEPGLTELVKRDPIAPLHTMLARSPVHGLRGQIKAAGANRRPIDSSSRIPRKTCARVKATPLAYPKAFHLRLSVG
jgi:hypothetical protein